MLEHGGRLRQAARHYGIPLGDWLDLSTGIAPWTATLPVIPSAAWQRLPEPEDGLLEAAQTYYGSAQLVAVPGSQAAIQLLPALRPVSRVGVLGLCYAEHAQAWRQQGHQVEVLQQLPSESQLAALEVLIVVNPNNPTGRRLAPAQLLAWQSQLARRGGWLIVDEAFMDATPEDSVAPHCPQAGLIVLRSLGKFFGLAGARVGFMLAEKALCQTLEARLGPWPLSGPARYLATACLQDIPAQQHQRQRLIQASQRLAHLLNHVGLPAQGGCTLFQWLTHPQAAILQEQLARRGIWVRYFHSPSSVRLGLPADEADWQRLTKALHEVSPCLL